MNEYTYSLWKANSIDITPYNLSLKGYSVATQKTGFMIPELSLFFDAGIQSPSVQNTFSLLIAIRIIPQRFRCY